MRNIILLSLFALLFPAFLAYGSSSSSAPGIPITGGTVLGDLNMSGNEITNADISASEVDPAALFTDGTKDMGADIKFDSSAARTINIKDEATADANTAPTFAIKGSNKTAGTGNGGPAQMWGGTSTGGAPGPVQLVGEDIEFYGLDVIARMGRFDATSGNFIFDDRGTSRSITIADEPTADANPADQLLLQASNKIAGTGTGGTLTLSSGTSSGGSPGVVQVFGNFINFLDRATSAKIMDLSLADGIDDLIGDFKFNNSANHTIQIRDETTADSAAAPTLLVKGGNKTAGTGGGGNLQLWGGTSAGGTPGAVLIVGENTQFYGISPTVRMARFDSPTGNLIFDDRGTSRSITIADEPTADAAQADTLILQAANKTAGTGNGGDVDLQPGTSAGGSKGVIDANSSLISNVTDGVSAQDAVTKSQLDAVVAENFTDQLTTTVDGLDTIRSIVLADDDIVNIIATCVGIRDDGAKVVGARRHVTYFKDGAASLARIGTMTSQYQKQTGGTPALATDINDDGTDTVTIDVDGNAAETVNWKCKTEVIRENAA